MTVIKKAALGLSIVVLAACGGGGGSGGTSAPNPTGGGDTGADPYPAGVNLDGVVAKGIVSGALVEAYGSDGELIGTATTDSEGRYSITVGTYTGAVKLVLKPQEGALVTCDIAECRTASGGDEDADGDGKIEFGERYALDYQLTSVVFVDETATEVNSHITPLTTLVAEKAGITLNQTSISTANTYVKNMLGLDANPSEIEPVDLTKASSVSEQQLRFALLNAALEEVAENGNVAGVLDNLSAAFTLNIIETGALDSLSEGISLVAAAVKQGNQNLTGIEDAAEASQSKLDDVIAQVCGTGTSCSLKIDLTPELNSNLEKAKQLVSTVRRVTIETVDTVNSKLREDSDGYDSENVLTQLDAAEEIMDEEGRDTVMAFSEIAVVLASQVVAVQYEGQSLISDIPSVAEALYDSKNSEDNCAWITWDKATQDACYAEKQADRDAYLSRFVQGTIENSGGNWKVRNAVIDLDGDSSTGSDEVKISLNLALPQFTGDSSTGMGLPDGVNELAVNGTAGLGSTEFTVEDGSKLQLELDSAFNEEDENGPDITSIGLQLQVRLENATRSFSGDMELGARKSVKLEEMGLNKEILYLNPEKLALRGSFSEKTTGNSLEASVVFTVDNAAEFGYFPADYERSDLTSYSYNEADNTLTLVHGEGENKATVRYSLEEGEYGWSYFIRIECLEVIGSANCPVMGGVDFWGIVRSVSGISQEDCWSNYSGYWRSNGTCVYLEGPNLDKDIRLVFSPVYTDYLLGELQAFVPGEGWYAATPDNYWEEYGFYESMIPTTETSGFITSELVQQDLNFNAEGRYVKFTVRMATSGRLSADLPEMDLELVVRRTGYESGDAALDVSWGDDRLRVEYPYTGEDSSRVVLTDGEGTKMELELAEVSSNVKGAIVKDGTTYGVIAEENDVYIVNWIDNTIETLY
ncbi:hypothetical protein [Microbulbifer thermotolerans]|uniref:Uncharacterized protein n=1 Tax=Microbulbifer thermotolerans TaxID=252514 RepID=A0A143HPH5_MICTH|nr:hypothetical protein [Microbulbifer thermotolerans]AMX03588.1 hypothetical protein A3224_14270 [Microbulbifer thermotolerans]MCX2782150.1 hypothetical protein [Microbulbifer thermotolerans]MCX2831345.1 hypothetical protein [Microbulbifer thermotolerans]SFD01650.1 hypothetical protein SAMN05660479_02919 [Microbulbifer thermotolerans]